MSNFHFDISLKLSQGEVHDVSEEVQKAKGRCKTISGEVRTSHTSPQNPAMYETISDISEYERPVYNFVISNKIKGTEVISV